MYRDTKQRERGENKKLDVVASFKTVGNCISHYIYMYIIIYV